MMHLFRVKQVLVSDDQREITVRYFRTPGTAQKWAKSHGGCYIWEQVLVPPAQVLREHASGAVLVKEDAEGSPVKKRPGHWRSSQMMHPDLPEPVRGRVTMESKPEGGHNP